MALDRVTYLPAQPGYRVMFVTGSKEAQIDAEDGGAGRIVEQPILEYADVVMWAVRTDLGGIFASAAHVIPLLMQISANRLSNPDHLVAPGTQPQSPEEGDDADSPTDALMDALDEIEVPPHRVVPLVTCSEGTFGTLEDATQIDGFVRVLGPLDDAADYVEEAKQVLEELGEDDDMVGDEDGEAVPPTV